MTKKTFDLKPEALALHIFASDDDNRTNLEGVWFEAKDGLMSAMATNGHILACVEWTEEQDLAPVKLPKRAGEALDVLRRAGPDSPRLEVNDERAEIFTRNGSIGFPQWPGDKMPDWRVLISDSVAKVCDAPLVGMSVKYLEKVWRFVNDCGCAPEIAFRLSDERGPIMMEPITSSPNQPHPRIRFVLMPVRLGESRSDPAVPTEGGG